MHIRSSNGCALVPVEERMVLNEAFEESCRFGDCVVVVTRLRPEYSRFKGAEVTNVIGAAELLNEQYVDG